MAASLRVWCAVLAVAAGPLCAQSPLVQTLPAGLSGSSTGLVGATPFHAANQPMLHQFAYRGSAFAFQGAQTIDTLSFRRPPSTQPGGTTQAVIVSMSSSVLPAGSLSNTFATNRGANFVQVYSGSIAWGAAGTVASPGTWVTLTLSPGFVFTPTQGHDLLIEVRTTDPANAAACSFEVAGGAVETRANTSSSTATTANLSLVTAPVIRIASTPNPWLQATTTGGGVADLTVSLTRITISATQGWTLVSTFTPFPTGTGPLLGLFPSQFTFDIIALTPSPGDPLAFVAGLPGLYPTVPYVLPPGSLAGFVGATWDFCAVITDGGFNFIAPSNVVRLTF